MMLKRILLVGMFFMLAGYFAENVKAAEMKIGVMNVQKIIVQCEAGKVGKVKVVGMDGIKPILEAIKEGVIESSVSTIPRMQGSISILMLWQVSLGIQIPQRIDTGIDVITKENVDSFLSLS